MKNKAFTGTFTLPDTLQFDNRPVHCEFTAKWQPPDPEVGDREGWWEADGFRLSYLSHCELPASIDSGGHLNTKNIIDFDCQWVQDNLDEIRVAITRWCDENYSNTDIGAIGDK